MYDASRMDFLCRPAPEARFSDRLHTHRLTSICMDVLYDKNTPKKTKQSYGKLAVQQRMRLAMAFLNPFRPVIAECMLRHGKVSNNIILGQATINQMLQ